MNELEQDDKWQRGVFDHLLRPILKAQAYEGQIVFLDIKSEVAKFLQKRGHLDIVAQLPHDATMSIEVKIVRWPGAREGKPGFTHWRDFFLERWSCTIPGYEQDGWMVTSKADILLWSQCALNELSLDCFPLPFRPLRRWFNQNMESLPQRRVENVINGHALWTQGRLAPIRKVCRDLKVEGFHIDQTGLASDLFGTPLLHFLREQTK